MFKKARMKRLPLLAILLLSTAASTAQTAIISGIDKSHGRTPIVVNRWHPTFDEFYPSPIRLAEAIYENDSTFTINIPILTATSVGFGIPKMIYSQTSWLSPNDNLKLILDKESDRPVLFSGANSANYNIYHDYNRLTRALYRPPLTNFADFQATYKHIDQQLDSLMDNALRNGATNDVFVKLFKVERKAAYVSDLMIAMKKFSDEDQKAANTVLQGMDMPFNHPALLSSRLYTLGLINLPDLLQTDSLSLSEKYELDKSFVIQHFQGEIKDFMLGHMTKKYAKDPAFKLPDVQYSEITNSIVPLISDSTYRQWALDNLDHVNKLSKTLPKNILNEVLLTDGGQQISIRDMLNKHKGNYVLLDIWASWCVPCIEELEAKDPVTEKWKGKKVDFIYLSVDSPSAYKKMQNLSAKYGITNENYILQDLHQSPINKYLKIFGPGIPRYVLFDKEGKLQDLNMPRPSSGAFDHQIAKHMQKENVITY